MTAGASLIGLDWGTSSFRAYRIEAGEIVDRHEADAGILTVADRAFEARLREAIGPWLDAHGHLPVIASGMITSRQGWVEVPYVPCPCGAAEIARGLGHHELSDGRPIQFVPGISIDHRPTGGGPGIPDVIRGEETQIVGALTDPDASGLYVLPGTHSKWVQVEAGRITAFSTFMTGEVFGVLRAHSILGRLMSGAAEAPGALGAGFELGLDQAAAPGGLLRKLFSARTLPLFDRLAEGEVAGYLSGLLIGSEIDEALSGQPAGPVMVVGSAALVERYGRALRSRGIEPLAAAPDVAARGLARILAATEAMA